MPRRIVAALALVGLLASCGSVDSAAVVNGAVIRTSDLEQTVEDFATVGETEIVAGAADGETVRGLLTSLIRAEVTNQVLADASTIVTDDERNSVRSEINVDPASGVPQSLIDLIIELNAATLALGRVPAPNADVIKERYNANPKSLGMLCLRHLVVEKKATALRASSELGAAPTDAKFAEVAGKYSIEPNAKESGGVLGGQSGECISLNEYQAGFDPDFVAGALSARAGVPTEPVQSAFGWHIIFVRPLDAVNESVTANLSSAAGEYLLLGALADADITVASRYGRWDPLAGGIVAP